MLQNLPLAAVRLPKLVPEVPNVPFKLKLGNISAVATPILAEATCSCASAARMSGRWFTRSDGRLTGKSIGSENLFRLISGKSALDGNSPSNVASKCSACAKFCSRGANERSEEHTSELQS